MQTNLPALSIVDGKPMADSRHVAATFGKNHKDVLRAYRNIECSVGFRERNFAPFENKDLTGISLSHVLMTKTGFSYLVFGFTGSAAAVFKEAYVERFDAMEEELRRRAAPAVPQSLPEALRLAADLAEQVSQQKAEIAVLEPRSRALATIADTDGSFCIRDAAKALGLSERILRDFLRDDGWIYRRDSMSPWIARANRLTQGWMTTKVIPVETSHGRPWNRTQARITCAGLVALAQRLGRPVPPEAQRQLALPAITYA